MTYLASQPVQKAIFTALTAKGLTVYDEVPTNPSFPYVVIFDAVESADNRLASYGRSNILNIHVWSRYSGNKEVQDSSKLVIEALDNVTLTIAGLSHTQTHYLDFRIMKEQNLRHGIIRFRIDTQEI